MTASTPPNEPGIAGEVPSNPHRLELVSVELVGAGRTVDFHPGLNIVQGEISSGKTTFVRLLRGMLGTLPDNLVPEVEYVRGIRGNVIAGDQRWWVYRPRTTTTTAAVDIREEQSELGREPTALRLPVAGKDESYSTFLLGQLKIPAVSVPQARTRPTDTLTPVTMTDWLGYCIVTGDEIDTQIFGHHHPFRDIKRKWVFELAYGYYDPDVARRTAELRRIELQLQALERDATILANFVAATPFADATALEQQLTARRSDLERIQARRESVAAQATDLRGVQEIRQAILAARTRNAELADQLARLEAQLKDLADLRRQLVSQSARLTRATVADEWLVDFDFIVCPRCGNDVNAGRAPAHLCYLCLQEPRPAPSREQLLAEQDRITSQIGETDEVVASRRAAIESVRREARGADDLVAQLSAELDRVTRTFVSDRAAELERNAAERASLEAEVVRLQEYLSLVHRYEAQLLDQQQLEGQRDVIIAGIERRELSQTAAEDNVRALEERMLEYLHELHIPQLGEMLTVKINRNTYLPEVAARTFDELSSQGLKTLVNIAHALAHHTVAIDRGLALPGLLILDGLSANAGFEGFDQDRVKDVYQLVSRVATQYQGALQLVAVDNELPRNILLNLLDLIVLTLTQETRLIRIPSGEDA